MIHEVIAVCDDVYLLNNGVLKKTTIQELKTLPTPLQSTKQGPPAASSISYWKKQKTKAWTVTWPYQTVRINLTNNGSQDFSTKKKKRYSQQFQLTATNSKNFIQLYGTTLYPKISEVESLNTEIVSTYKDIFANTAIDYALSSKINIGGAIEYKHHSGTARQTTLNYIQYPSYTDSLLNVEY